jgi:hypothetical protein
MKGKTLRVALKSVPDSIRIRMVILSAGAAALQIELKCVAAVCCVAVFWENFLRHGLRKLTVYCSVWLELDCSVSSRFISG